MDPYQNIAAHYDLEHEGYRDDLDFYLNIVRHGPVLEVGVGTGRIMAPLVEAGFEVWGVDHSPAMLKRARQRLGSHQRAHLVAGSIHDLQLDVAFRTALMPLNVLWHLRHLDDRLGALRVVHDHLVPGGMLIIDLSNPFVMADRGANGELRQRFAAMRGDHQVRGFSTAWDDEAEQLLKLELIYDETDGGGTVRRSSTQLELRYVYRSELDLLLRLSHFAPRQVYGSYDLEAYSSESPNLIVVAASS